MCTFLHFLQLATCLSFLLSSTLANDIFGVSAVGVHYCATLALWCAVGAKVTPAGPEQSPESYLPSSFSANFSLLLYSLQSYLQSVNMRMSEPDSQALLHPRFPGTPSIISAIAAIPGHRYHVYSGHKMPAPRTVLLLLILFFFF